jgi:hypothetical protein
MYQTSNVAGFDPPLNPELVILSYCVLAAFAIPSAGAVLFKLLGSSRERCVHSIRACASWGTMVTLSFGRAERQLLIIHAIDQQALWPVL